MALWKTKRANTLRVAFPVIRNGALEPGLATGNFNVELLSPDLSATTGSLTVAESPAKAGIYYVDAPTAFLATHGINHYGLLVEVHKPAPQPIDDIVLLPLEVIDADLDDLSARLPAALVGGRMDSNVGSLGMAALGAIVTAVMDFELHTGFSAQRVLRIIAAAVAGKSSGGKDAPVFRNLPDDADQITGAADSNGDRTAAAFGP